MAPQQLEKCVQDVKAKGHSESNAYAICVQSTGWKKKKGGGWTKKKTPLLSHKGKK